MLFLIQNTQNRDANAIQPNINELLRTVEGARAGLVKPVMEKGIVTMALQKNATVWRIAGWAWADH